MGHLRFSASCHAAGVPHLADSGWLPYSCGDGLACGWGCLSTDVLFTPWVSTWCLRSFPFCCFPFGVLHPFRVRQHVWLQLAGLLLGLSWRFRCCATWFSPMCRALPQGLQLALFPCCRFPSGFQVTGCLSFCFPGAWVELSPSLLSGLLLLHWVDGAVTLLPFPYLRVRVLLAYGVSGAGYNFKALSCTAAPRAVCNTRLAALTPDL